MLEADEIRNLHYVFRGNSVGADKMLRDMQRTADEVLSKRAGFEGAFTTTNNVTFLSKEVPF